MKSAVRYYTRSGNTKKLAEAVAAAIGVNAEDVSVPLTEKTDILFLGCSYYAFDVDDAVKEFIRKNSANIREIVCFGTSAMMRSMQKPLGKVLAGTNIPLCAREFHCRGRFGALHKSHPNDAELAAAAEFAKSIQNERNQQ